MLVLPTLSDNFGLVIAEALERGKRVITTDGAPAWEAGLSRVERVERVEGAGGDSRVERVERVATFAKASVAEEVEMGRVEELCVEEWGS